MLSFEKSRATISALLLKLENRRLTRRIANLERRLAHTDVLLERRLDRAQKFQQRIGELRAAGVKRTEVVDRLRARRKHLMERVDALVERDDRRLAEIARLRDLLRETNAKRAELFERVQDLTANGFRLSGGLTPDQFPPGITPTVWRNAPVNRYLNLANNAELIAAELEADAYLAHGVAALPAAHAVAAARGGRVYNDVIEIPSFTKLALPTQWSDINVAFLDNAFEGYLRRCDGLLSVGWALAAEIEALGPPVAVVPNYRYREPFQRSDRLRELCAVGPDDRVVLSLSTVATGMEAVVEAIAALPSNVHLAQIGPIVREDYDRKIRALVEELGLADRVHYFDAVAYEELVEIASGADVGLIVRDPAILNNYISLPNRVFDYLASGVPICAPDMPDISRIVRERDAGAVVAPMTGDGWRQAIETVLARRDEMRANAEAAAAEMTWESVEDTLWSSLGEPARVTIFGVKNMQANNRTQRIARSLAARGTKVKICYPSAEVVPDSDYAEYRRMPPGLGTA